MTKFGYGAVAVIGHRLDQDSNAIRAVALVSDLVIIHAFEFAHAAFYRTVNGVVRHVLRLGIGDRLSQPRIRINVAAVTGASRDRDLLDHLRKDLATFGVESAFLVLDSVPLAVS